VKVGDLIGLWGKDANGRHDTVSHIGIYMGWDLSDDAWKVLVDEKIEIFASTWWHAERVIDDPKN